MKIQWDTFRKPRTISTNVEPDPWHIERPTVWYLPGGGGNWLNYMIWCHFYERNIPGNYINFHLDTLTAIDPAYRYIIRLQLHTNHWRTGIVGFGSHNACLNIWMNNCRKLGHSVDHKDLVMMAVNYHKSYDWDVIYNIQWHLIVTDPEFMLQCLNDSLGLKLTYTPAVQHAFQQYIDSCWPPELQGDAWKDHYLTKAWVAALRYQGIDPNEVTRHWTPYYPDKNIGAPLPVI